MLILNDVIYYPFIQLKNKEYLERIDGKKI